VHLCTIFAVTLTFDAVRGAFRDNAALFVVMIASFGMAAGTHWEVFGHRQVTGRPGLPRRGWRGSRAT
jgi:hypothetical protein